MGREWNREVERDRAVLERILALLLSLASLADRAAGAPDHIRYYVLDCLAHGEAAARALLIEMAAGRHGYGVRLDCAGAEPPDEFHPADDPALIAATLRVLALALVVMLAETAGHSPRRLARPRAGSPGASFAAPAAGRRQPAARAPAARGPPRPSLLPLWGPKDGREAPRAVAARSADG